MLKHVFLIFCLFLASYSHAQYFDTIRLYYDIGIAQPDNKDKHLLDSVAKHLSGSRILIYGYADYLGHEDPNLLLSEQRAKIAMQYLVEKGFPKNNVMQCAGSGQLMKKPANEKGNAASRRTDIFIIRPKSPEKLRVNKTPEAVQQRQPDKAPVSIAPHVTAIDYETLQPGDTVNLKNIGFYPGMKRILPASYPEVDHLIRILQSHPTLKIRLEGHVCCCTYPDGYFENTPHWQLSVARARELRDVLVKNGISAARLEYTGFGRTHPITEQEETSEQGQINRRVEIRILEK